MKKPNVLVFLPDGMQAEVLNAGHPCFTPNFDRLCERGVRFTRAYSPSSVCSPARASFMTGLLPHNHGVLQVEHCVDEDQSVLRREKVHWAQRLCDSGYRTGYFGKWHIERTHNLEDFGWQVNGIENKAVVNAGTGDSREGGLLNPGNLQHFKEGPEGYKDFLHYGVTDQDSEERTFGQVTNRAQEFLKDCLKGQESWACCISFSEPNEPMVAGQKTFDRYDVDSLPLPGNLRDDLTNAPAIYGRVQRVFHSMEEQQWREARACYFSLITEVDSMFGKILDQIEEAGELDDTIIILASDHGKYLGAHGMDAHNLGGYDEIYRIPLVISGPEIKGGVDSAGLVGLHDVCPTILELTGAKAIDQKDSRSFTSLLENPKEISSFQTGFAENFGNRFYLTQRILWQDSWKYVFNGFAEDELYNLEIDPLEMNNQIFNHENQAKVKIMMTRMWEIMRQTGDNTLLNTHYSPMRIAPVGPLVKSPESDH